MGRSSKKPEKSRENGTKRILVRPQGGPSRSAVQQAIIGCSNRIKIAQKPRKIKCLRLEGSNFRLGGIAPITRAVPSF